MSACKLSFRYFYLDADNCQISSFGSTTLRVVYGIKAASPKDEYITLAEASVHIMDKAYTPGKYLVEALPFLKHVPSWFPGAQFKRDAAAWKLIIAATRNKLFDATLDFMVSWLTVQHESPLIHCLSWQRRGNAQPSIVSAMVDQSRAKGEWSVDNDEHARDVSGIAYLGKYRAQGTLARFVALTSLML